MVGECADPVPSALSWSDATCPKAKCSGEIMADGELVSATCSGSGVRHVPSSLYTDAIHCMVIWCSVCPEGSMN